MHRFIERSDEMKIVVSDERLRERMSALKTPAERAPLLKRYGTKWVAIIVPHAVYVELTPVNSTHAQEVLHLLGKHPGAEFWGAGTVRRRAEFDSVSCEKAFGRDRPNSDEHVNDVLTKIEDLFKELTSF